jgi:germination protein M
MRLTARVWLLIIMILFVAMLAGCDSTATPAVTPPSSGDAADKQLPGSPAGETMRVTVYYATKDALHLVPEVYTVPKTAHPAQSALELLLNEPKNPDLVRVLPEGTKLRGVTIKDHVAYADFSNKLVKNGRGGSASEIMTVGAIVNTLTEFPDIHKVQILVEGKKIDTLYGHLDTGEPMSRSESIIKK